MLRRKNGHGLYREEISGSPADFPLEARYHMTQDEQFMAQALELARQAAAEGEAPIGCVITRDGEIVGRGRNCRETGKTALGHAELLAIEDACRNLGGWRLWQCRMYVTLEPCPMCAGAIINARIPTLIYGAKDPKAGSVDSVLSLFSLPFNHRPEVISGVLEAECGALLRDFFREIRARRKRQRQEITLPDRPEGRETPADFVDKPDVSGYDNSL